VLEALFADGRIADVVIAVLVLEGIVLAALYGLGRRGLPPREWLASLAAGLFLLLAMRTALTGGPWYAVGALLAGGGLAHFVDLRHRWRWSSRRPGPEPEA
jgi:chromate transport protein ChrA